MVQPVSFSTFFHTKIYKPNLSTTNISLQDYQGNGIITSEFNKTAATYCFDPAYASRCS